MVWLIYSGTRPHQSRTLVHRQRRTDSLQTFHYGERFDKRGDFGWKVQWLVEQSLISHQSPCPACVWQSQHSFDCSGNKSSRNSLRRFVDCHWYRNSYLRLGWEWIKVLYRGWRLFRTRLSGEMTRKCLFQICENPLNASFRSELFLCFCSFVSQPGQEPVLSALGVAA